MREGDVREKKYGRRRYTHTQPSPWFSTRELVDHRFLFFSLFAEVAAPVLGLEPAARWVVRVVRLASDPDPDPDDDGGLGARTV